MSLDKTGRESVESRGPRPDAVVRNWQKGAARVVEGKWAKRQERTRGTTGAAHPFVHETWISSYGTITV